MPFPNRMNIKALTIRTKPKWDINISPPPILWCTEKPPEKLNKITFTNGNKIVILLQNWGGGRKY